MEPSTITLPIVSKAALTELYVFNDNTGGNAGFIVRDGTTNGEITRCNVSDNQTAPCDHNNDNSHFFPPGIYKIEIFASCGSTVSTETYLSGRRTTRIFC
jgi:hypothetical protein